MTQSIPQLLQLALDALNSGDVLHRTRAVVELEAALSQPMGVAGIPEPSGFHDPERLKAWGEAGRQIAQEEFAGVASQPQAVQQDRPELSMSMFASKADFDAAAQGVARVPLTDAKMDETLADWDMDCPTEILRLAGRAVEAAHGIGPSTKGVDHG